jgi:hypothetical protein
MSLRSAIDQVLIIFGVLIIVTVVALLEQESWTPLGMAMGGILLVGLGIYRLGHRVLPNRRVYIGLRSEVDYFIRLVRRLNLYTLQNENDQIEILRQEMKNSVDRMVSLAGRPGTVQSGGDETSES